MFLITAMFAVVFAFSGCEKARAAPAADIAIEQSVDHDAGLQSNKEMLASHEVTAFAAFDSGLQLSIVATRNEKATMTPRRIAVIRVIEISPPEPQVYFAAVRARPKINGFSGIGHNHFARADV